MGLLTITSGSMQEHSSASLSVLGNSTGSSAKPSDISFSTDGGVLWRSGSSLVTTLLTKLGTVDTGTWNATAIGVAYGGTGTNTYTNGQILVGQTSGNTLAKRTLSGAATMDQNGVVTIPHSGLTGLDSGDPHTQYAILAGRSGGQTLIGSTASGGNLVIKSNSGGSPGSVTIGHGSSSYLTITSFQTSTSNKLSTSYSTSVGEWGLDGISFSVGAGTYTDTDTAGTRTATAISSFAISALASTNAVTHTDCATVYIEGSPLAGTNTTLTNKWSLWVDSGQVRFDDHVRFVTAYFSGEIDNGNSGTTKTIDWTAGNNQKVTMTGNCTFTFTAPPGVSHITLKVIQDGTGSRTITWPTAVKWAGGTKPTQTTTASAVDIMVFYFDGTNYHGAMASADSK